MVQGNTTVRRGTGDDDQRFSHLIQPIRDLTKNWDVDIAAQLEDYLDELEHISITFDGGSKTLNFADAALLIQGSACVYSKKVEYLFSLVYQVLDILASNKKLKAAASSDGNNDNDATFAQRRDDDEEFLSLDDIPQLKTKTKKIDEDNVTFNAVQVLQKTPLALVSLDEAQKGDNPLLSVKGEVLGSRMDFKMNYCRVHSSGFLLLDLSHLAMLKTALDRVDSTVQTTVVPSAENNTTTPSTESQSNTVVAAVAEMQAPLPDIDMDADDGPAGFDNDVDDHTVLPADDAEEGVERRQLRERRKVLFAAPQPQQRVDIWEPLDPHQGSKTADRPFRKKKTFRLPACLKAEANKKRKHDKDMPESKHPLLPIADFCDKAYFSHASKFPSNPLKMTTFPEFEDMFYKEYKRRLQRLAQEKKRLASCAPELENDDDGAADDNGPVDDNDDDDDNDNGGHLDFHVPEIEDMNFGQDGNRNDEGKNALDTAPVVSSYEDLVRQHVDGYMASAQQYAQLTDLARRVTEWEEQLVPRLQEEERRETFDIHKYGTRVMDKMDRRPAGTTTSPPLIPFRKVVENQPPFQVCRTFLATLQLANAYNVEIIQPEGSLSNSLNSMQLRLLSTRRHHEELEEYRAPSLT